MNFKDWCASVRERYKAEFLVEPPKPPSSVNLDDRVQERMMRVGIEATALDVTGFDDLVVLAHHALLLDDVKHGRGNSYHRYA